MPHALAGGDVPEQVGQIQFMGKSSGWAPTGVLRRCSFVPGPAALPGMNSSRRLTWQMKRLRNNKPRIRADKPTIKKSARELRIRNPKVSSGVTIRQVDINPNRSPWGIRAAIKPATRIGNRASKAEDHSKATSRISRHLGARTRRGSRSRLPGAVAPEVPIRSFRKTGTSL